MKATLMSEKNVYLRVKTFGDERGVLVYRVEDIQTVVAEINRAANTRDETYKVTIEFVLMTEEQFSALPEA